MDNTPLSRGVPFIPDFDPFKPFLATVTRRNLILNNMSMKRTIKQIIRHYSNIDYIIPGVNGQRPFPTSHFRDGDPFLMLDQNGPKDVGTAFYLNGDGHEHPHRGFETVSLIFDGNLDHLDSINNDFKLRTRSALVMNAGGGIIHGGDMYADPQTGKYHQLQLWVNLPAESKMSRPRAQYSNELAFRQGNTYRLTGMIGRLNGLEGPLNNQVPTQVYRLEGNAIGELELGTFDQHHNVMLYALQGNFMIDDQQIGQYELAQFNEDGNNVTVKFDQHSDILILAGQRINEPIVYGGPFVMNTQTEIKQAYTDFQMGRFGTFPKRKK